MNEFSCVVWYNTIDIRGEVMPLLYDLT